MEKSEEIGRPGFWQRYRGLPPTVFALSVVSFLNDTSSDIIYPLLPAFLALTLGATPFAIGLIEGFAESVASILKLFSGYLSDKFGQRKLPVFLGYSLAAVLRAMHFSQRPSTGKSAGLRSVSIGLPTISVRLSGP